MLGRQQELDTRFQQLIEPFLLAAHCATAGRQARIDLSLQISGSNQVRDFLDRVKLNSNMSIAGR